MGPEMNGKLLKLEPNQCLHLGLPFLISMHHNVARYINIMYHDAE